MADKSSSAVRIRAVESDADLERFVRLHHELYRGSPAFRSPLDRDVIAQLTPGTNPWFDHATARFFVAERDGEVVGRLGVFVDEFYDQVHEGETGFFGFFECEDDRVTATALTTAAEDWCRAQGAERIIGPVNLSVARSAGILIDGYQHPNYVHTPHGKPYYPGLLESAGFQTCIDLYVWRYTRQRLPKQMLLISKAVARRPGLMVRQLDMDRGEDEIAEVTALYNASYADTFGFTPMTVAEMEAWLTTGAEPDERISFLVEVDDEPAAFAIGIPNTNEIVDDLEGRLYPTGWIRHFYRRRFKGPLSYRQLLFGVKPRFRGKAVGGMGVFLYTRVHRAARAAGYQEAETTMTVSVNERLNNSMQVMGAERYKMYRIYEKPLTTP